MPSNIFIQFLAGPANIRGGLFGRLLRAIAWSTLVIAPVLLLLLLQIQFLPFHNSFITWTHRIALLADLILLWWLWRKILSGPEADGRRRRMSWTWTGVGFVLSVCAVLFCCMAVTFPGEWQETHGPDWRFFPGFEEKHGIAVSANSFSRVRSFGETSVSLHDLLFNLPVDDTTRRRKSPFSSTLVLSGLNVYEGLAIDDPEKANWRDYVFRARGRDLKGAIFDLASLPKVDFSGAELQGASLDLAHIQGASLDGAQLEGASFNEAQLQGASLRGAQLQGASLYGAQLQGARLDYAQLQKASLDFAKLQGASLYGAQLQGARLMKDNLQGATLNEAQLRGASFNEVQLQGASFNEAQLQGAWFYKAQLQGASLVNAQLQLASLELAQLQGASLVNAQLQGASLQGVNLNAVDLWGAFLWRSAGGGGLDVVAARLFNSPDQWQPVWRDHWGSVQPWNAEAYQDLRTMLEALPPGNPRGKALDNIRRLACANPNTMIASCNSNPATDPPEVAALRKALDDASVDDVAYGKALALALKTLVCSGDADAVYVLRGVLGNGRLTAVGPEAPALVDFIMSKECPVSASLTDADKATLLQIKRDATKEAGK